MPRMDSIRLWRPRAGVFRPAPDTVECIDASFFGDPGNGPLGPQRRSSLLGQTTAAFSRLNNFGGHNQTVR